MKEASRKVMASGVLKAVFPFLARSMGAQKAAFWVGDQVAKIATEYETST